MKDNNKFIVRVSENEIFGWEQTASPYSAPLTSDLFILPGFTDVHVHLREPGFLYKETMTTGTMAAAAGGFTHVFSMPNLNPCPDSYENLKVQLDAIAKDANVHVYPYGAITVGEKGNHLAAMEEISPYVIAFSDDGFGVSSKDMMRKAMEIAKGLNKIIVAHCEDENYPKDSSQAEWKQLERDLELVRETGCKYHVCHISTKESVELIRNAKAEGLDVTCETAPHYLTLTREDAAKYIQDHENPSEDTTNLQLTSGMFKMNPPLKHEADRQALLKALADGTIDMIATDHAPHSQEEKSRGFWDSAYGIVGLENAFSICFTHLVDRGIISLEKLVELLYVNPRKRFGLEVLDMETMLSREKPTYAVWDLGQEYTIDPKGFLSKGKSTPFQGWKVKARCLKTVVDGETVFDANEKP